MVKRLAFSARLLDPPESAEELTRRFLEAGFIEAWLARLVRPKKKGGGSAQALAGQTRRPSAHPPRALAKKGAR
jgi:hypothetical protein